MNGNLIWGTIYVIIRIVMYVMQRTHTRKGNTVILTQHTYEHNEQQGPTYTLLIGDGHAEYPLTDVNQKLTGEAIHVVAFDGYAVCYTIESAHRTLNPDKMDLVRDQIEKAYNELWGAIPELCKQQNIGSDDNQRYYLPIVVDDTCDWGQPCNIHIYKIYAPIRQLNMVLDQHIANLGYGPTGADDDCFDYWPSGFGVARDIAIDIDRIEKGTAAMNRVRSLWDLANDTYKQRPDTDNAVEFNDECVARP